ncbi:MAG: hypothetical protein ABI852_21660, partial [Gemmatimonadaceae bacterium]
MTGSELADTSLDRLTDSVTRGFGESMGVQDANATRAVTTAAALSDTLDRCMAGRYGNRINSSEKQPVTMFV